ncbi:hypothetical protein [Methylobacterium sp. CM6247]
MSKLLGGFERGVVCLAAFKVGGQSFKAGNGLTKVVDIVGYLVRHG